MAAQAEQAMKQTAEAWDDKEGSVAYAAGSGYAAADGSGDKKRHKMMPVVESITVAVKHMEQRQNWHYDPLNKFEREKQVQESLHEGAKQRSRHEAYVASQMAQAYSSIQINLYGMGDKITKEWMEETFFLLFNCHWALVISTNYVIHHENMDCILQKCMQA